LLEETRALTREVTNDPDFYASDAALDEAHRLEDAWTTHFVYTNYIP